MNKKIIVSVFIFFLSISSMYAAEKVANQPSAVYQNIDSILATNKRVDMQGPFIDLAGVAGQLSPQEKMALYMKYKQKPAKYLILNGIGFGIGSWAQGDVVGGLIGTVMDGAGLAMTIVGAKKMSDAMNDMIKKEDITENGVKKFANNLYLFTGGIFTMLASRTLTILKASKRVERYNDFLYDALNVVQTITVLPAVTKNGNVVPAVTGKIAF